MVYVATMEAMDSIAEGSVTERKLRRRNNVPPGLSEELGVLQQDDLLRQGSITQLVVPLAIYVRDSNRKG